MVKLERIRFLTLAILLSLPPLSVCGQFSKNMNYIIEATSIFSDGDYAPFWFSANKYGLSSVDNNNGYLRAGLFRPYEENKKLSYRLGVDLATAYNFTSSFVVQQAYFDLKYGIFELSVGSKERQAEFRNHQLSSGSMVFSNNARPIPQMRIGIPEYWYISKKRQMFAIKGHVAYGAFTDDNWQKSFTAGNEQARYTQNALYHSKSLFIKIGNEKKKPLVFEGSLETAAQFGGESYNLLGTPRVDMPNGFVDFLKIFFAGGSDSTDGEYANVYGNHLGSWGASLTYHFPTWKIRAYYEHPFEDHSMIIDEYAWKDYVEGKNSGFWAVMPPVIASKYYWKDCMVGLEVTLPQNPILGTFIYEYMATREQSGPLYHDHTPEFEDQIGGRDNYYNHTIFTGWQHWGQGIGHPFITAPLYNTNKLILFAGNRNKAHHIGLSGQPTPALNYRFLLSHIRSWGTYREPYVDIKQTTSILLEAVYAPDKLKGWTFSGAFAFDHGKLIGNNTGVMISVCKKGFIAKN